MRKKLTFMDYFRLLILWISIVGAIGTIIIEIAKAYPIVQLILLFPLVLITKFIWWVKSLPWWVILLIIFLI